MVAASKAEMWSTVMECSSGFPFTVHRQQIDDCSVVLISTHSSANTEKYGLDFWLSTNFLSSLVSTTSLLKILMYIGHSKVLLQHAAEDVGLHLHLANAPPDQM